MPSGAVEKARMIHRLIAPSGMSRPIEPVLRRIEAWPVLVGRRQHFAVDDQQANADEKPKEGNQATSKADVKHPDAARMIAWHASLR